MNKTIKVFPLLLVFILNFALFISTPYSKTILNVFPMSDCIWSTIYFVSVFLGFNYYIYCYFMNSNIYNFKKSILIFFILFGIRVIFDLTYYFFNDVATKSIYALFMDFTFDILFVYITLKVNIKENIFKDILKKIHQKDIRATVACILIIVAFFISLILLLQRYSLLYFYSNKYTDNSILYIFNNMNFIFESQYIRVIFSCISEVAMLYICNIIYFSAKEKYITTARKVATIVSRLMISIMVIFAVLFIKIWVNQVGMISLISTPHSSGYVGDINKTYNNHSSIQIYRASSKHENFICYEKMTFEITHQRNIIFSFNTNTFCDYGVLSNLCKDRIDTDNKNNILQANGGKSVIINNIEIIFYSNQYIVFVENTIPQVISFDNICNTNKNDILTEFLEKMITYGYWDFFEYGCDYLLKYDPNFITPYINRYSVGGFTENEKNINTDIREEYMIKFSSEKL